MRIRVRIAVSQIALVITVRKLLYMHTRTLVIQGSESNHTPGECVEVCVMCGVGVSDPPASSRPPPLTTPHIFLMTREQ